MAQYFDELKLFVRFDATEHEALRRLHPLASPYFSTIAQDFYDRLKDQPRALSVFRSEEQVLRLQATLVKWMDRLLAGTWDEDYFELRARIGKVHVQIGLPQHFMFSAMAVIQGHLIGIATLGSSCIYLPLPVRATFAYLLSTSHVSGLLSQGPCQTR